MNLSYDNIVSLIVCLLGIIGGYVVSKFTSKNSYKVSIYEKRLELVYLPLFKKLEPNLYKRIDKQTALNYIAFFNDIKNNYYELIDSHTLYCFEEFEKSVINGNVSLFLFSKVCYSIDRTFENLRKQLHLPCRSFLYKWLNSQYPKDIKNRISFLLNLAAQTFIYMCVVSFMLSLAYLISKVINLIISLF